MFVQHKPECREKKLKALLRRWINLEDGGMEFVQLLIQRLGNVNGLE